MLPLPKATLLLSSVVFVTGQAATNVALRKPTTESSFYGVNSSGAVDGNTNPGWGSMSCFQAGASDPAPWWQVDLRGYYAITTIVATARTGGCCDTRLHDFYVEVYEYDPAQYPSQPARVCLDYEGVVLAGTPVTLPCTTVFTGRFVKLRRKFKNPGDDRFTICELEVYGPDSCLKSSSFRRTNNKRMDSSNTITPTLGATVERCALLCSEDKDCFNFNHQRSDNSCEIIHEGSTVDDNGDWDHYSLQV
ncbi:fucolectin-like isoform X1 [Haliotis rufescens]|uniref:fucolectin-like isoform X1 n=1 Tax=Haliotis rufescens TaxID=6454 RepID=UPI001EAFBE92|nr:fucolectin-like isoform X1 [Haliotis rufescens]